MQWVAAVLVAVCVHMMIFGYVFDLRRHAGAIDAGYGGFEVGLGLIQEPVAEEEPEVVEEPPKPEEIPEEPAIEPVPPPQPTPVIPPVIKTTVQAAAPSSKQLTLKVRPRPAVTTPQQVAPIGVGQSPTYGGAPGIQDLYIARLSARLNRFKFYPIRSLRRGEEGVPVLVLVIDRRGRVLDAEIAVSSGFEELDRAALRIVENAKPLPRFDRRMQMAQLRARIPITFEVTKQGF